MEYLMIFLNLFVCCYLNDITVYNQDFESHLKCLNLVFKKIKKFGFTINPEKTHLFQNSIGILGNHVSFNGISTQVSKNKLIQNLKYPNNVKEVKSFLGIVGFYRKFICNFAEKSKPLTMLLHKKQKFIFEKEQKSAFDGSKNDFTNVHTLSYPYKNLPYNLFTDASDYSINAVLNQSNNYKILFLSRTLSEIEQKYSVYEKELLAVVFTLKKV